VNTTRMIVWAGALALAGNLAPVAAAAGLPSLDKIKDLGDKADKVAGDADKAGRVIKGATGLSLKEEVAIGDTVSLEIVARYGGLWCDAEATRRVNLVGRALARFADRQDLVWRFGLLDSDALNAFSAPGGRVFITRALYQMMRSDDELAGVLGHEIEHIDRRHALKIIARGELFGGISDLVSDRSKDFAELESVVGSITSELFEKGFDPDTEFDADKFGRRLARTTGYAPGGLRAVIQRLKEKQETEKSREVFSTHPAPDKRLKKLPNDPAPPA